MVGFSGCFFFRIVSGKFIKKISKDLQIRLLLLIYKEYSYIYLVDSSMFKLQFLACILYIYKFKGQHKTKTE